MPTASTRRAGHPAHCRPECDIVAALKRYAVLSAHLTPAIAALAVIGVLFMHGLPIPAGLACHMGMADSQGSMAMTTGPAPMGLGRLQAGSAPAAAHQSAPSLAGAMPAFGAGMLGSPDCISDGPRSSGAVAPVAATPFRFGSFAIEAPALPGQPGDGRAPAGPSLMEICVSQE